jgi:phosphoglycolate phosphatase-like HAD superfamily hydrolase
MIAAVATATGSRPTVIGKPHPRMHLESVARIRATRPIVVGDRLDTDIGGAIAAGCASLLVLSGITDPARVLAAEPGERPNYLAPDVRGLLDQHRAPRSRGRVSLCGAWRVVRRRRQLELTHLDPPRRSEATAPGPEPELEALRALCQQAWASTGAPVRCQAGDSKAEEMLARLELDGC